MREPPYYKVIQQKVREDYYTQTRKGRFIMKRPRMVLPAMEINKSSGHFLNSAGSQQRLTEMGILLHNTQATQHHILKEWIEMMERADLAQLKLEN